MLLSTQSQIDVATVRNGNILSLIWNPLEKCRAATQTPHGRSFEFAPECERCLFKKNSDD